MSAPWTLGRKLTASGAVLVFVMAAGTGIAYWGLASLSKDTGDVADRGAYLSRTRHAETLFNELFFGERSQIMAAFARDKALYDRWISRNRDNCAALEKLLVQGRETANDAGEREQVEKLVKALGQWKATYPEVMKLVDSGQLQEAYVKSDKDGKPVRDASRAAFADPPEGRSRPTWPAVSSARRRRSRAPSWAWSASGSSACRCSCWWPGSCECPTRGCARWRANCATGPNRSRAPRARCRARRRTSRTGRPSRPPRSRNPRRRWKNWRARRAPTRNRRARRRRSWTTFRVRWTAPTRASAAWSPR